MWRIVQGIPRAIRTQWGISVRSAPQSGCHDEGEQHGDGCRKCTTTLVAAVRYIHSGSGGFAGDRRGWHEGGKHEGHSKGPETDWHEWMRSFRRDLHCGLGNPQCLLEAAGISTFLLLGIQLSHLWQGYYGPEGGLYVEGMRQSHCLLQQVRHFASGLQHGGGTRMAMLAEGGGSRSRATAADSTTLVWDPGQKDEGGETQQLNNTEDYAYESQLLSERADQWSQHGLEWTSSARQPLWKHREAHSFQGAAKPHSAGYDFEVPEATKSRDSDSAPSESAQDGFRQFQQEWDSLQRLYRGAALNMAAYVHCEHGDIRQAAALWQRGAEEQRYGKAQFNLGLCYQLGRGVDVNPGEAARHYRLAADQGHPQALHNLAMMYMRGEGGLDRDVGEATTLLDQAARAGLRQSQTELGVLFTTGLQKDMMKAAALFQQAADQQHAGGQYYLGVCYEHGWGVEEDRSRAAGLYRQASDQGQGAASFNLAVFTEKGMAGLQADPEVALSLYERALAQGFSDAQAEIDRLTNGGHPGTLLDEGSDAMAALLPDSHKGRAEGAPKLSGTASTPTLTDYLRHHLLDLGFPDPEHELLGSSAVAKERSAYPVSGSPGAGRGSRASVELGLGTNTRIKFYIGDDVEEESAGSLVTKPEVRNDVVSDGQLAGSARVFPGFTSRAASTAHSGVLLSATSGSFGNIPPMKRSVTMPSCASTRQSLDLAVLAGSQIRGGSFGNAVFQKRP